MKVARLEKLISLQQKAMCHVAVLDWGCLHCEAAVIKDVESSMKEHGIQTVWHHCRFNNCNKVVGNSAEQNPTMSLLHGGKTRSKLSKDMKIG